MVVALVYDIDQPSPFAGPAAARGMVSVAHQGVWSSTILSIYDENPMNPFKRGRQGAVLRPADR